LNEKEQSQMAFLTIRRIKYLAAIVALIIVALIVTRLLGLWPAWAIQAEIAVKHALTH